MDVNAYRDINLLDVSDGVAWGLAGEAGMIYQLSPLTDLRMCASDQLPAYVSGFTRMLSAMPVQSGLTFEAEVQAGAEIGDIRPDGRTHPLLDEIRREKVSYYAQYGRAVRYYASLWTGGVNPLKQRMFPPLLPSKKQRSTLEARLDTNDASIREMGATFAASLSGIKIKARALSSDEVINRYWKILAPAQSETMPAPGILNEFSLRSQLTCCNSLETPTHFFLDGTYHLAISFYTYPDELFLGSLDTLLENLPPGARYVFSILVPDQEECLESLKKHRQRAVAMATESRTKDYESQTRERSLDDIITRCREQGERIYTVTASVLLRARDLETLGEYEKNILFALREIFAGATGITEHCLHRRTFLSSLPFNGHLAARRNLMMGATAGALAPLSRAWQGTKEPGMILAGPCKDPVNFSVFEDGTPRHGCILGQTGSGKSFSFNLLLISLLTDPKMRTLIIDVGGSFKRLCEVLGGAYFDIKIDEQYAINPLLPRTSLMKEDGTFDPECLAAQTSLLCKITQTSSGPGRVVLEKALERIYRKSEEPLLSDLYKELKEGTWDDGMRGQAQAITSELMAYCEGVYSLLLSRNSRIRPFEKQITVFDLAGMKEHRTLQSVMVSVIAFSLNRQLEDRSVRRVICIDEAWEFFNDAASAELVERLYRQARKQNAAIITLSQSPVEFLDSPASPAILGNSHWCMALKMASAHELLAKFGFTDQSIEHARQMQIRPRAFSEVCVRYGDNSPRILRIAPTSKEYWIATTNADECVREAALRIKNKTTITESIAAMAKDEPVVEW